MVEKDSAGLMERRSAVVARWSHRVVVVAVVVVVEFIINFIIIVRSAQVFNAAFLISCTQLIYDIPKYPKQ